MNKGQRSAELSCEAGAVLLLWQSYGPAAPDLRHALLSRGDDQNRCFAAGARFSTEPGGFPFHRARISLANGVPLPSRTRPQKLSDYELVRSARFPRVVDCPDLYADWDGLSAVAHGRVYRAACFFPANYRFDPADRHAAGFSAVAKFVVGISRLDLDYRLRGVRTRLRGRRDVSCPGTAT